MMSKLIPLAMLAVGFGAGAATAFFSGPTGADQGEQKPDALQPTEEKARPEKSEFIKLSNQFVVPIILNEKVSSLVVLSLSLETVPGMREAIYEREPKLRDAILQVLFDHSNMGGFTGAFTKSNSLDLLRTSLREIVQMEFDKGVIEVLITDIARQDN
jgi:hypothetical protein